MQLLRMPQSRCLRAGRWRRRLCRASGPQRKVVMRSGLHFARFTVLDGDYRFFGAIRPGWDVEGGVDAFDVDGHCFYATFTGTCFPDGRD